MSATVKVHCPNCSQPYSIPVERLGKQAQCEQCNTVFTLENPNLAPCPDCFANISRRALTCPRCGAPLRSEAFQVGGQTVESSSYDAQEEKTVFVGNPAAMYYFFNFLIGAITIPAIVGIFIIIHAIICIRCTQYTVTTKRVLVKRGWLNTSQVEIWIKDMRGVHFQQDIVQRLIGTGSIAIGTAATAGSEIQMHGLRNAQELVDTINSLRK